MNKVDRDFTKVPDWLDIAKSLVPDFIIKDPKNYPIAKKYLLVVLILDISAVWEVVGSEFTQSKKHTAGGILHKKPMSLSLINFPPS